jgi:hypothetical protein
MMSFSAYMTGFFINYELLPILTDYAKAQNRKKGDEILIVHCCFSISQNELKF